MTATISANAELVGQAISAAYGHALPPDATFTLRISDGVVKRYPVSGTYAPYKTTFYGLFARATKFDNQGPWALPPRWAAAESRLDLAAPLDFVSTNDNIARGPGSPSTTSIPAVRNPPVPNATRPVFSFRDGGFSGVGGRREPGAGKTDPARFHSLSVEGHFWSPMGRKIRSWGRQALRLALAVVLVPVGAVFIGLVFLPWPLTLRWKDPAQTSFMEYRIREARAEGRTLSIRHEWVPLEAISRNLRRAVLVAEDDRFYQHHGIDWRALGEEVGYQGDSVFSWWDAGDRRALREALAYAWAHRSEVKGRSTITQQVAKNLYFTPARSLVRKLAEVVVSKRLELFLTKDRILEIYLNVAEWGPGVFGAEAAARSYFDRGADELTLEEAVTLAATLPHPLTSNPLFRPARMAWRRDMLLVRLRGPAPPDPPHIQAPLLPDTTLAGSDTASTNGGRRERP